MEIQYLKKLRDNPTLRINNSEYLVSNSPISEQDIGQLEQLYNNGNLFPKALKELLFLAGSRCYVVDYGLNETQQELQEFVRENMQEENRVITRPFYAIDVYNAGDQFLFVYLDEGNNPAVYLGEYWDSNDRPTWITLVSPSLSDYINRLVDRVKNGQNPF